MARAAAKRKTTPKPPAGRGPRQPRAVRKANRPVEQTLFFHRIRRSTKWVFAALAIAFAFTFVVAGVGSGSTGVGSVLDAFGGLFGSSSSSNGPSLSKALKQIQKNPKDAAAYYEAAQAAQTKNQDLAAINYYESYLKLRPKDTRALAALAGLYENQLQTYSQAANQAQASEQPQSPLAQGFGPSSSTKIGQALQDPIEKAVSSGTASSATSSIYQQFAQLAQQASENLEKTYRRLTVADPSEPSYLLEYARYAQALGNAAPASAAYKKFLKSFPDDPNAGYVKKQLKTLTGKSS
jgi:tetratricopeptide (TPR) repeat protein